jgi:hypothetical protein
MLGILKKSPHFCGFQRKKPALTGPAFIFLLEMAA